MKTKLHFSVAETNDLCPLSEDTQQKSKGGKKMKATPETKRLARAICEYTCDKALDEVFYAAVAVFVREAERARGTRDRVQVHGRPRRGNP